MHSDKMLNVGIIGTGFIGNGLLNVIRLLPDMQVSAVLTHRDPTGFDQPELYTDSVQELIDRSDLVAECSGDILYAAEVTAKVLQAGLPVVTMDAELQITAGTYLSTLGMTWLAKRQLRTSVEWAVAGGTYARNALVGARERRAELDGVVRALDEDP